MPSQQAAHRNWTAYNKAQTSEKLLVLRIINDAVNCLPIDYSYKGNGRPSIGLDDMLKCCIIKVYNGFSFRRTTIDLRYAYALRFINQVPHFNTVKSYMQKEELMPYLRQLYKILSMPLVGIEEIFATDATGFSTFSKKHWSDLRLDVKAKMDFKKLHVTCGVKTKIITSAIVTEGRRSDHHILRAW